VTTRIVNVSESELDIAVVIVTYKCAALTIDRLRSVAAKRSEAGFHIRGSAQITLWNYLCFFSLIRATRDIGVKTRGAFALLLSRCSSTRSYGRDYRIRFALKDSPPIAELPTTLRSYHLAAR
jgi:hypothetical protein